MRFPIKFKTETLPAPARRFLPHKPDPLPLLGSVLDEASFSRCVSSICIDGVWKTTQPARHTLSNQFLCRHLAGRSGLRLLDVGVSDGVTSSNLLEALGAACGRFWGTDLYLSILAAERKGVWYFYRSSDGKCVMAITNRFICYHKSSGRLNPLGLLVTWLIRQAPDSSEAQEIRLVNPGLKRQTEMDSRVTLAEWNIFMPWSGAPMDVIRAANVLNPSYFSAERLRCALRNIFDALTEGGLLHVVDNRELEKATLFEKRAGRFHVVGCLAAGCEIGNLCVEMDLA